jgi:hypothetical protein
MNDALKRIKEIESQDIPFRFEICTPLKYAISAALFLQARARDREAFWVMPSEDVSFRFRNLVIQIDDEILRYLHGAEATKSNLYKLAICEDLIRNVVFAGRSWGGISGMHVILQKIGFLKSIINTNLPKFSILQFTAPELTTTDQIFHKLVSKMARKSKLGKEINVYKFIISSR